MTFFYCEGCDFYEKEWLESRKAFYYVCAKEKGKPFLSGNTTPIWCSGCERGGIPLDDWLAKKEAARREEAQIRAQKALDIIRGNNPMVDFRLEAKKMADNLNKFAVIGAMATTGGDAEEAARLLGVTVDFINERF